jgi:hypothetical protein
MFDKYAGRFYAVIKGCGDSRSPRRHKPFALSEMPKQLDDNLTKEIDKNN